MKKNIKESPADAAHRAEVCEQLSPVGKKLFQYIEFDANEELLSEIRKHPLGLVGIALTGIFITLAIVISSFYLAISLPNMNVGVADDSPIKGFIISFGLILGVLTLAVTAISLIIYARNVIYVTSQKIAQVNYLSLFNRQVTQLGIGNVEDVTVHQRGILAHIFGYGTLRVETAGELPNPEFSLVPKPYPEARIMVTAHEDYVEKYGN